MPEATVVLRAARLALHLVIGVLVAAVLQWLPSRFLTAYGQRWAARSLEIAHVRLITPALAAPGRGTLILTSSWSWLEVLALGMIQPNQLVCRAEVRRWPVVGRLAMRFGTIFTGTASDDLRILRRQVGLRLDRGRVVVGVRSMAPEGLEEALLQAAADVGAEVQAVKVRWLDGAGQPIEVTGSKPGRLAALRNVTLLVIPTPTPVIGESGGGTRGHVRGGRKRVVGAV